MNGCCAIASEERSCAVGTCAGHMRDICGTFTTHCLGLIFLIDMGMRMSFVVCVRSVGCRLAPSQAADDLKHLHPVRSWIHVDICGRHMPGTCAGHMPHMSYAPVNGEPR